MSHFILKDAFWQILGRLLSAIGGFVVIKLMTPYLGPLRFGDYSTILKYFAIRSALADFGLYVLAIKKLGEIKQHLSQSDVIGNLSDYYSRFVTSRLITIVVVYTIALGVAYMIPSYTSNPYLVYGLPMGMLFSASFMVAGILQLPIQLYGQMQHTSVALTLARIVQIFVLIIVIGYIYPQYHGTGSSLPTHVFLWILSSVVLSGIVQGCYVRRVGSRYIALQWIVDWKFTWNQLTTNWQYGFAYYLSSFHTLIVVIILSVFFPTMDGFLYVGIWAFALQLMELALIVPSSMANSLLHKVSGLDLQTKKKAFGNLLNLILWIAFVCLGNFIVFGTTLIHRIGGDQYLTTMIGGHISQIGSDFILPFLGIVLILSFIKQIFNYIFVSLELHNNIFWINLFGVLIGSIIGIPLIYYYNLIGGIVTQLLLECCFTLGAIWLAYKKKCLPVLGNPNTRVWIARITLLTILSKILLVASVYGDIVIFAFLVIYNTLCLGCSYRTIKDVLRGLKI